MSRLRNTAVAVLAVGALALAGCAEAKSDSASQDAKPDVLTLLRTQAAASLKTAADRTEKAESLAFTTEMTFGGQQVTGKGTLAFGPPLTAQMRMEMPSLGSMEVRLIGGVEYIKMPAQSRAAFGGKTWVKVDLAKVAESAGLGGDQFAKQFENADPTKQIELLLASGKLKVIGEEQIGGVKTVHYSGLVPVSEYLKSVDAKSRAAAQAQMDKAGIKEIATDLWVDELYQPRQVKLKMGQIDSTTTYTDYGKPVNVTAPPAAETADLAELRKGIPT